MDKAFGTLRYDKSMSEYKQEYRIVSQWESLKYTEGCDKPREKMNILVVCQYYYPEPFRITNVCEALVEKGHAVTVVTGTPNYPEGVIYKGYEHGEHRDEVINGVHVRRCPLIARQTDSFFRFLNYYSFVISSLLEVRRVKKNYDVVFINQLSPVMMARAGISWAKKNMRRCVLYCLDLWPESLLVGGIKKGSLIYSFFLRISKNIYRNVDQIIVSSRGFLNYFGSVLDMEAEDIQYLPQYAEEMFDALPEVDKKGKTVDFLFAGNVGTLQSVETIVGAAQYLKEDSNIHIHIVGSGIALENCKNQAEGLENITFHGRRPLEEMPQFYAMADVLLVTMEKNTVLSETLPGKVQSYLAAGKPVVGAIDGETARVVNEDAQCGLCCAAEDAEALSKIIREIASDPNKMKQYGQNAREYYLRYFQKKDFISRLESILRENCLY